MRNAMKVLAAVFIAIVLMVGVGWKYSANDCDSAIQDSIDAARALVATYIMVGNASGVATDVAMSGDGTLSNAGVLTLSDNAVPASQVGAGTFPSDVVYSNTAQHVTSSNSVVGGTSAVAGNATVGGTHITTGASTAASFTTAGEVSQDGKYTVTGGDASTGLMVQKAAITATGTSQTNTFAVAFGAAPIVVCVYTEDPGDVRPIWVTTVGTTSFISNHASSKNYAYIAIGTRP